MLAGLEFWWSNAWPVAIALVIALIAAWVVYRLQRREERDGVLSALLAELQLHESWVGNGYPRGSWQAGMSARWWELAPDWNQVVYKLSTVATDNAIQSGPSLFLNQDLVRALVQYRQRASQFNQLIDDMAAFRAASELWVPGPHQAALRHQLNKLAGLVHEGGIGDQATDGANHHYYAVRHALRSERTAPWYRRWAWFWLGSTRRAEDEPDRSW